jgi:hypothetical protein
MSKTSYDPEWARERDITAQFGLTHMLLFNLRKEGKIRSLSTKGDGKNYGARLFNVASIRAYLAGQEAREIVEKASGIKGAKAETEVAPQPKD